MNVTESRCKLSEDVEKKRYEGLKVLATIADEIARADTKFVSHWSVKYRSRSPGQGVS